MSALENLALEKVRERIGAIVLLTQNSGGTHYMKFVNTNIVDGALDLMKEDYGMIFDQLMHSMQKCMRIVL